MLVPHGRDDISDILFGGLFLPPGYIRHPRTRRERRINRALTRRAPSLLGLALHGAEFVVPNLAWVEDRVNPS